jgi:hypothetical protein
VIEVWVASERLARARGVVESARRWCGADDRDEVATAGALERARGALARGRFTVLQPTGSTPIAYLVGDALPFFNTPDAPDTRQREASCAGARAPATGTSPRASATQSAWWRRGLVDRRLRRDVPPDAPAHNAHRARPSSARRPLRKPAAFDLGEGLPARAAAAPPKRGTRDAPCATSETQACCSRAGCVEDDLENMRH